MPGSIVRIEEKSRRPRISARYHVAKALVSGNSIERGELRQIGLPAGLVRTLGERFSSLWSPIMSVTEDDIPEATSAIVVG